MMANTEASFEQIEDLKQRGNGLFSRGDHRGALNLYDEALELVCRASEHGGGVANVHAVLLSNRAAVYTQLEQYDNALASADAALLLRPAWDKAFFRKGLALFGMGRHAEALAAVQEGLQQSPNSADLQQAQSLIGSALHRPAQSAIAAAAPDQPAQLREAGSQTALEAALATLRTAGRERQLPVMVVSGFLGSGKSTLLSHILSHQQGLQVAVIVNDMAEVNIDVDLVRGSDPSQRGSDIVELTNGCICCTLRDDLLLEVASLVAKGRFDYLIIESTGVSEPMPVAAAFHSSDAAGHMLADFTPLDSMVTVVDASNFERTLAEGGGLAERGLAAGPGDTRALSHLLIDQVEFADTLLVNKMDLVSEKEAGRLKALLQRLNPAARQLPTSFCRCAVQDLLLQKRFRMEEAAQAAGWQRELLGQAGHLPETLQYGISSFVYRSSRPFHPLRLWAAALEPSSPSAALSRSHANGADVALSGFQGGPMADVACAGSGGDGGDGQVSGVASSGLGGGGQAASGTLSHDGSQGGATTAVPRRSLPAVLRSKGFFSLAPQPEVVWEWSTVGHDKRFRPYGRWAPPSPSPGDSSGTTTSKPCVAPSLATNNAKPASKRGAEPRQPARLGGIAAGGGEEGEAGGRQPQQRGDFFEQRLVFIGADVEEAIIREVLDSCLLTDQEMRQGRLEWATWPCPWDVFR